MTGTGGPPTLAVVGAINVDLVVSGAPLPAPGETVTGGTFAQHHGGKGGNQAVAAARSTTGGEAGGIEVWMVGAVGTDALGTAALEALRADGVRTNHVLASTDAPTGVALIAVGPDGENQISVAPGANVELDEPRVVAALRAIEPGVVLCSLEVGRGGAGAALTWARDHGVAAILNPAPWRPWARTLIGASTIVTPNEAEREALGSIPEGVVVIETRGAAGAVIHDAGGDRTIAAPAVEATDTTGAGDCFSGVLAAAILDGRPVDEAVRDAVVAASLSTTVPGAREGMPDRDAIAQSRSRSGI